MLTGRCSTYKWSNKGLASHLHRIIGPETYAYIRLSAIIGLTRRTSRRIEHRENGQLLFHTLVLYTRLTAENNVALLEEAAISLSLSFSLLIHCQIRWFTIAPLGISRPCGRNSPWQTQRRLNFDIIIYTYVQKDDILKFFASTNRSIFSRIGWHVGVVERDSNRRI